MDKKISILEEYCKELNIVLENVAIIGDDINDLGALRNCGLSACPSDAMSYVKEKVDLITQVKGGQGVVREVADLVLAARGEMDKILKG